MARPKTGDTRKMVTLPAELAGAVEDYRFANRLKTEAEAIRRLIEAGLNVAEKSSGTPPSGGSGGSRKPSGQSVHTDQDAERGTLKPASNRKKPAAPERKAEPAAPRSKLDQIRALREQGAQR